MNCPFYSCLSFSSASYYQQQPRRKHSITDTSLTANDSVAFVILWLALSLFALFLSVCFFFLFFFFGSDVAEPLYLSGAKPVAGLYWADYHAPSVGAIRDARARIQGPVTCPAGWGGGAGRRNGLCGVGGLSGGRRGPGYKGVQRRANGGCGEAQQGSTPSSPPSTARGARCRGGWAGLTWKGDGRLKAPEEDAGDRVRGRRGVKLWRREAWVIL